MTGTSAEYAGLVVGDPVPAIAQSFKELGACTPTFVRSSRAPATERAYRSDRRRSSFAATQAQTAVAITSA